MSRGEWCDGTCTIAENRPISTPRARPSDLAGAGRLTDISGQDLQGCAPARVARPDPVQRTVKSRARRAVEVHVQGRMEAGLVILFLEPMLRDDGGGFFAPGKNASDLALGEDPVNRASQVTPGGPE